MDRLSGACAAHYPRCGTACKREKGRIVLCDTGHSHFVQLLHFDYDLHFLVPLFSDPFIGAEGKEKIGACVRFAWYSLLAGGTGAVLLIPEAIILGESGSWDFFSKCGGMVF